MLNAQEVRGIAPIRSIEALHPKMRGPVRALHQALVTAYETNRTQFLFQVFETFRTPHRQAYLLHKNTTKAGPWESAHNFGLAADFVPFLSAEEGNRLGRVPGWYWPAADDNCWIVLVETATQTGLVADILWDKPHVEHPSFRNLRKMLK